VQETIYHRRSLGELSDPWLLRSLHAWHRISDAKGRFHLGRSMSPIFRNPGLLLPTGILFRVDGGGPEDFVIVYQGAQATLGLGKNMLGCRLCDYADQAYIESAGSELQRAVTRAEIAYHEVEAQIAGRPFHYDRLLYPVLWRGQVDQLLTVARWRFPVFH